MSVAINLPKPEVKEIHWSDLSDSEKSKFARLADWPLVIEVIKIPTLMEQINEDH